MKALSILCCLIAMTALNAATGLPEEPPADAKKVVFLAGKPSHGYGSHEHFAGCLLLAKSLESAMPGFRAEVYRSNWPDDEALKTADVVVMYSDGGGGHPALRHLDEIQQLADRGIGIVCIHYAVEVPKGPAGDHFLNWIGGLAGNSLRSSIGTTSIGRIQHFTVEHQT